jgi:hypothetical protein
MFSTDAATLSIGSLGLLELFLAFRMSLINMEQMAAARAAGADGARAAAAQFLRSPYYRSWSRAQLNNTEYAPMLGLLMLVIRYKADREERNLSLSESISCIGSVAASLIFTWAAATQGTVDVKNMRPGSAGMSKLRPVGALSRYIFMACLCWHALKPEVRKRR